MQPDQATQNRIKNLAIVGKALIETANDNTFQSEQFAAKEALREFHSGIKELILPVEVQDGMDKLVKYLDEKIERRMKAAA